MNYSNCCNFPMPEYPDNDYCPKCGEHAEPINFDDEELTSKQEDLILSRRDE